MMTTARPTHLRANDPEAHDCRGVEVDGLLRLDVMEANAAEGWADVLKRGLHGRPVFSDDGMKWETERIHGSVRFLWPESAP